MDSKTATDLQNRDLDAINWGNLIDEIEGMGKSERRALQSYLERLLEHLLKLKYWRTTPRRREAQGNARGDAERDHCE